MMNATRERKILTQSNHERFRTKIRLPEAKWTYLTAIPTANYPVSARSVLTIDGAMVGEPLAVEWRFCTIFSKLVRPSRTIPSPSRQQEASTSGPPLQQQVGGKVHDQRDHD